MLVLYDLSRGAATLVGAPTLWQLQPAVDRWLFFGVMPTVWLQERLKMPQPPWWEVIISTVYMSFFIVPYAVAGFCGCVTDRCGRRTRGGSCPYRLPRC
ncbi:PAP2 superfamily domain protein [Mycobacterium xenopi 4042]|uniref:PAP2 superfamily domain protein n=1 Tax=Mycobacterium xenopi 4042 TaxID=1299334 RepID=X7Z541_MYCXE|nr:PAP2 superfamily domain protein [Mycobacterium xenopi 4042]